MEEVEALAAMEAEWWSLWERDPRATPFQSPAWLLPWVRNLWGGGRICVLALRHGEELAGLAPLFLWGYGDEPEMIRVSFLGSGVSDYLDLVALPGLAEECARATLSALGKMGSEWDECDFQELRSDSALLAAAQEGTLRCERSDLSVCPVAALAPTIEEHLAGLDSKFRTDLRRAENRLRSRGTLTFRREPALLGTLFRLHATRWRERSEAGVLATGRLQAFHREAARQLQRRGMLRLYGLFLDGECLATQYNMAAKRRAYAYLSGFDPAWGRLSPGAVLLKHAVAEAIAEGVREFDFLREPESFKYLWGARDHANHRLVIWRRAAAGAREAP